MRFPGKMAAQVIGGGLFHKPATQLYPAEKPVMPKGFRGRLTFYAERCVFCKLCMKDCPSEAIQINKIGEKKYEAILNMGRCIYCGQCVQSCNKDALEMTTNYELAVGGFDSLTVNIGQDLEGGPEKACEDDELPGPEAVAKSVARAGE